MTKSFDSWVNTICKCIKPCFIQHGLTHYQTTNFRLFQTERDDNFKFDENGRKFSKRVENTVGKGEIASNFSFSHGISKD